MKVYCTGGYSENGSPVLIGAYAEEPLLKLTADICFISSSSLSDDGDVTDINEHENKLRKIIMERVKVKVLLLDNSKKAGCRPTFYVNFPISIITLTKINLS